jgi:hypothetical protein
MTSLAAPQLTLNFEPALPDRFPTLRKYVAHRVHVNQKSAKTIAADMDMSPSLLSRKLTAGDHPDDKDTQRFNCDDLEEYLKSSGDAPAVIEYLAAKYMDTPEARKARTLARVESLLPELMAMVSSMKETA